MSDIRNFNTEDEVLNFLNERFLDKEFYLSDLWFKVSRVSNRHPELNPEDEDEILEDGYFSRCFDIGNEDEGWSEEYIIFKFKVIEDDEVKVISIEIE